VITISGFLAIAVPILIFVLILGVVVFIHELGHYLMARRAGVFVEEFALGMGPKLLGFRGKSQVYEEDRTLYSLRMFPIGGFCRMRGMDDTVPDDPTALNNKTVLQRMSVIIGGSLFNFIAAFLLFFLLVLLDGYSFPQVHSVREDTPAYHAGLMAGDRITHINGRRVALFEDFVTQLEFSGGRPVDVRFVRDGQRHNMYITPVRVGNHFQLGFFMERRFGFLDTVPESGQRVGVFGTMRTSAEMILFNMRMPFTLLARFIAGDTMPEGAGVMGPIGMAGEVTVIYQEVISRGILPTFLTMLFFTALLNAALGVMNMLPIPALDGARLVFLGIEGVRRRPVSPEREGLVHMVGFVLLMVLAVFIAYRDIVRLIY